MKRQLPTNSKGLTVAETLAQPKQTQDEANYIPEANENVCGTCRFFLRPESGEVGACQVVEGDINWNGTSDLYISAEEEAMASLAEMNAYTDEEDDKKRGAMNKFQEFYETIKRLVTDTSIEPTERAISFEAIREQAWNLTFEDGWLIDVYDDAGQMYALLASNGHLLRQQLGIVNDQVQLAGDSFQVSVDHPAIQTRTTIQRQKDDRYRWFSISATSVLNRVGAIDSKTLFDSFISHIEETNEYPVRQFYHQGLNFRTGQGDFVARDDNCLLTSGLFDDTELAKMEIKAREKELDYWGESIGYLPTNKPEMLEVQEGINIPIYTTGILREISTVPEIQAANLFTVTIQQEEVNRMLTGKAREAFVKIYIDSGAGDTEDAAEKWLSENIDGLNRAIQESGMITRDKDDDKKPVETEPVKVEFDDALVSKIEEIVKRVGNNDVVIQEQMTKLVEAVETLNANQGDIVKRLDTLQADADGRFKKLERSRADDLKESIENLPAVPQVRRYEYIPRQGNSKANGNVTMADHASGLKSHY